jgi:hypothetical protein
MACIKKLENAIAYDCDTGATGLVSAIIINKADIASFTVDTVGLTLSALTLKTGAKAFKIDTVKRSLVVSSALKINDGAPNAYSHSATIVYAGGIVTALRTTMEAFTNGSFVILAKGLKGLATVYGLYYGLSATSSDRSSHDNGGWITTVLSTPENVIGEDPIAALDDVYDALYAAAAG